MYKYSIKKKPRNEFSLKVRKTVEVPEVSVCWGQTVSTGRVQQVWNWQVFTSLDKFKLIHSLIHYYGLLGMGSML